MTVNKVAYTVLLGPRSAAWHDSLPMKALPY